MFYLAQPGQVYSNGQKNYEVIEAIGFGVNGIVYKAKDSYGNILALKYQKEFFEREYVLLQLLVKETCQMNHVIKILDVFPENPDMDTGPLITIMELGEKDFDKYTSEQEYQNLSNMQKLFEASEILQGIKELHKHDLFHRDIKPQNIVQVKGKWKLCDLGLIKEFKKKDVQQTRMVGTGLYLSPELYADSIYLIDKKVDVWSFAVMLYYLIYNEYPFDPKILRRQNSKFDEKIMNIRKSNDPNIDKFFQLMLEVDPKNRIDSYEALLFLNENILHQKMQRSIEEQNQVSKQSTILKQVDSKALQQKNQQNSGKKTPFKKASKQNEKEVNQNEQQFQQGFQQGQCQSEIIIKQDNTIYKDHQVFNSFDVLKGSDEDIKQKNSNLLTEFIVNEELRNICISFANKIKMPKDKRIELIENQIKKQLTNILDITNLNQIINDQKKMK